MAIYHGIEQPIRRGSARRLTAFAGAASLVTVVGAGVVMVRHVEPQRSLLQILYLQHECFLDPEEGVDTFASKCLPGRRPLALLLGDSHAAHLYRGLSEELSQRGFALGMLAASACPPIQGYLVDGRPHCVAVNAYALSMVRKLKPKVVILSAIWKPNNLSRLSETLKLLSDVEGVTVAVVGNTPIFEQAVPVFLKSEGSGPIKRSDRTAAEVALQKLLPATPGASVRFISLEPLTCPGGVCALASPGSEAYYLDEGHLTA
jgi:hypothetical protein